MIKITNWVSFLRFWVALGLIVLSLIVWLRVVLDTIKHDGEINITTGTAATNLWQQLANDGYTRTTLPWRYHAWRLAAATNIQAGNYQIERGERVSSVIKRFMTGDATISDLAVTYPEGFTLVQIAERTAAKGIGSANEFIALADPASYASKFEYLAQVPSSRDLEGYLFPDTYSAPHDTGAEDIVYMMVTQFRAVWNDERVRWAEEAELTVRELITIASLVEAETGLALERPLVAAVYHNRLRQRMLLQCDPTLLYALYLDGRRDRNIRRADFDNPSPYNTYRVRG
ncbi:endolytic transglycosylase MltG, partial [Patescibacteria group bacterium]|nr:endolytic transglycosylase MltG [Patescibacteria group bacterium]